MKSIAVFGTDIVMVTGGMDGVMTVEAGRRLGIPAFTVEVGGGLILWEGFIRRALVGLHNILVYHEMIEGSLVLPERQFVIPGEDDMSSRAPIEGVLHLHACLGKAVDEDELLAEIVNPVTQERANIRSRQCGVVHAVNVLAKVDIGDDVVGVLEFTSCPERGRKPTAANVETLFNDASDEVQIRPSEVFDEALTLRLCETVADLRRPMENDKRGA